MARAAGSDLPKVLVAKYLAKNGYQETLNQFLTETSLSRNIIEESSEIYEDLDEIIAERLEYNEHVINEKIQSLSINSGSENDKAKLSCLPSWNHKLNITGSINSSLSSLVIGSEFSKNDMPIVSTSNKELLIMDDDLDIKNVIESPTKPKSIIKLFGHINGTSYYYICDITGGIQLMDENFKIIKDGYSKLHSRLINNIKFQVASEKNKLYIASTGADNFLQLTLLDLSAADGMPSFKLIGKIKLLSLCTSLILLFDSKIGKPLVYVTRLNFSNIQCFIPNDGDLVLFYQIALNTTKFSTHQFDIRDMILYSNKEDKKSYLLAVTSHIPYARILVTELPDSGTVNQNISKITGIAAFYDQVLINMATQISQTNYSQPILRLLPDDQGLIIGIDTGIYAIDIKKQDSWLLKSINRDSVVKTLALSPTGSKLLATYADKGLYIWDINVHL